MNNTLEQKRAALNSKNVATLAIQARPSSHVLELLGNLQSEWSITFISSSAMMLNNWVNEERNVDINISEIVFKFYPIMQRQSLEWLISSVKAHLKKKLVISWNCRCAKKVFSLKTCPQGVRTSSPVGKIQILYFYQFLFCRLAKNSPLNKINLIKVWIWAVLISRSIAKSFFGLGLGCKIYDLSQNIRIGTIQVLRRWLYKAHPPTYVSMNSTVNQQKLPFSNPTNQPCWHNTWMVPF